MMDTLPAPLMIHATDGEKTIELHRLTLPQLRRIDRLLEDLGDFGELRLIVENRVVKYVEVVVSRKI